MSYIFLYRINKNQIKKKKKIKLTFKLKWHVAIFFK